MLKYYIISILLLLNLFMIYRENKKETMAKKKRPCEFNKRTLIPPKERTFNKMFDITKEKGMFHQWGKDIQEDDGGASEFSVGIVEDHQGNIHLISPNDIQFTD